MAKVNNQEETKLIHEKMAKYFKPVKGSLLIEYVSNLKTSGGVYLPETAKDAKAIAHPIIAIGEDVDGFKVGEWISLRAANVDVFLMYGRKFSIIRDFDIMMTVDMEYYADEAEYNKSRNKIEATIVEETKRTLSEEERIERLSTLPQPKKDKKLIIN